MIKNSFIYTGNVVHKRFKPKIHFFKYKVFSLLIDLSEIHLIDKKLKIFSYNKFNIISFYDKDHGARDGSSVENWVKENLKKNNINTNDIQIKLLCYPRILGYVFNPLSVFYIYDKNSNLISIFYEVKNTFGEQHTYIFKTDITVARCAAHFMVPRSFSVVRFVFRCWCFPISTSPARLYEYRRVICTMRWSSFQMFSANCHSNGAQLIIHLYISCFLVKRFQLCELK